LDNNNLKALISLGILDSIDGDFSSGLIYLFKAKELQPQDPKILFNIGNVYLKEKNFLKAIEFFKSSLQNDPENLKTLESLMISQSKIEKWDDLISTCKRILQIDNTSTKAIALLVKALKENKKYKDLEIFLKKIDKKADSLEQKYKSGGFSKNPEILEEDVLSNIAKLKSKIRKKLKEIKTSKFIYHNLEVPDDVKDYAEMNNNQINNEGKNIEIELNEIQNNNMNQNDSMDDPNIYLEILKNDEMNLEAIFNLGMHFHKKKEYESALEYFNKLIDKDFQNLCLVLMKIGDIYYTYYKDMSTALENYKNSNAKNKTDICYIKIGRCYAFLNQEEKEIESYKKAMEINPEQEWANFYIGTVISKKSKPEEALTYFKKAYELDKSNVHFIIRYCEELSKSKNNKDLETAIEILKSAKLNFSNKVDIHITLSDVYLKLNEFDKAIEILEEANRIGEFYNNADKLFKLGVVYEKINDFNKAVSVFKTVLNIKKDHAPSLCHVGFILASTKEYKRSLKYFKYAIKVNPNLAYAHYGIAKIFQQIGNFEDALENYAICLEKNPNNFKYSNFINFI